MPVPYCINYSSMIEWFEIRSMIHSALCFLRLLWLFGVFCSAQFSSVQLLSHVRLCNPMNRSTPGLPVHHQLPDLPKLMSIESVMPSDHLIFCHPLLLPPSIFHSIRVFSMSQLFVSGGQIIGVSASASVLPMNT